MAESDDLFFFFILAQNVKMVVPPQPKIPGSTVTSLKASKFFNLLVLTFFFFSDGFFVFSSFQLYHYPALNHSSSTCYSRPGMYQSCDSTSLLWQKEASDIPSKSELLVFLYFT